MRLATRLTASFFVTCALLGMLSLIAPQVGSAAVIELRSCMPLAKNASSRSGDAWSGNANSIAAAIRTSEACPDGLRFDTSKHASFGDGSRFSFGAFGIAFDSIRFKYQSIGPDTGYRLTLHECEGCDALLALEPTYGAEAETATVSLNQPTRIYVSVQCLQTFCAPSGEISFNSIVVRATDVTPPTLVSSTLRSTWSRRSDVTASFKLADVAGVGLGSSSAWVDGTGELLWSAGGCTRSDVTANPGAYYGPAELCPTLQEFRGQLPLADVPDGIHAVRLESRDGLGNVMPSWLKTFKIDDTPPNVPEDLAITPKPNGGWIHSNVIAMDWTNSGEVETTNFQSGLSYSYVDVKPLSESLPDPPPVETPYWIDPDGPVGGIEIPADGEWDIYAWTRDWAGNSSGKIKTSIARDADTPDAPTIDNTQWFNRDALLEGRQLKWTPPDTADLESGICGYAVSFDSNPDSTPTQTITNPGDVESAMLPANLSEGVSWAHVRAVSCAGLASSTAHRELRVDLNSPTVVVEPAESANWLTGNAQITITASDEASGLAGIEYELSGGPKRFASGPSLTIELPDGVQNVRVRAFDIAGNRSPWRSLTVNVDRVPPVGTFVSRDIGDPTRLAAYLDDSSSGLARAEIQIRREDNPSDVWFSLPTNISVDVSAPQRWLMDARVPDETLPTGSYSARVVAYDKAGNLAIVNDLGHTGIPMRMALPTRERSVLNASLAPVRSRCRPLKRRGCSSSTKCKKPGSKCVVTKIVDRRRARSKLVVSQTSSVAVIGSLTRRDGTPIANATVSIESAVSGFGRQPVGTVTTAANGSYELRLEPGPSRNVLVGFGGSLTLLPQKAQANLSVVSSASLRARSRKVQGGRIITFYGRLRGKRAEYPMNQVMVVLEFWNGRSWQTGIGRAFVGRNGRFRVHPPYFATRGPRAQRRMKVRGFVRATGSPWPYQDGYTNRVNVRLR